MITVDDKEFRALARKMRAIFPIQVTAGKRSMLIFEERLKDRTLLGFDVNGDPFTPYSPSYAEFRVEKGRKSSPVDLFFSGKMQSAITHNVTKDQMTVFFADKESDEKAEKHISGIGVPERDFFAPNARDMTAIMDELIKPLDRLQ